MGIKRKYIHEKTGKIRQSNLSPKQAASHGYRPYTEPKVEKIAKPVKNEPNSIVEDSTAANEESKKRGRKPRAKKD